MNPRRERRSEIEFGPVTVSADCSDEDATKLQYLEEAENDRN